MKKLISLAVLFIALSFAVAFTAGAEPVKLRLLDKWKCAELVCGIAVDEEGNYLLVIGDKEGLLYVYHRGQLVYDRKADEKPV